MATSGIDSVYSKNLLQHSDLPASTAGVQASNNVIISGPLKLLFASAMRTTDTGSDTEWVNGGGYTAGAGFSGLTFAAASAAAPSTQSTNIAATLTNIQNNTTWAGCRVVDTAARTVTDASVTNTSTTITSLSACFSASDVGAAVTGTGLTTQTISTVNSAGQITISAAATATNTNVSLTITRTAVNTTFWAALASNKTVNAGDTVTVPSGSLTHTLG